MFRRWLSSFFKKNKVIILQIAKVMGVLIVIGLIGASIMAVLNRTDTNTETENSISIYNPQKTMISGDKVTNDEYSEDNNLISKFVEYCNNGNEEEAYKLISDDCKNELYPTVELFKNRYCNGLFNGNKQYNLQSWINEDNYHTYRVRFTEDFLSTGNYESSQKGQDYITVVTTDDDIKLNVNGFIKKETINKQSSSDCAEALAVDKTIYMDYEVYTIKIKNITDSEILLDTDQSLKSISMVDANDVKYYSQKNDIKNLYLELPSGVTRTLKIRFNRAYDTSIKSKYIEFSDIVTDVTKYRNQEDYADRGKIKVEM